MLLTQCLHQFSLVELNLTEMMFEFSDVDYVADLSLEHDSPPEWESHLDLD